MRGAALTGLLLLAALGCGGGNTRPTGSLEGAVTFEGKAVSKARVQVQSVESGMAAAAVVGAEGHYRIPEPLAVGKYTVIVAPDDESPPAGSTPEPSAPKERPDIPESYRVSDKSGLTVMIQEGKNSFDVKMTAGE